jgi:hypothetical protein
MICECHVSFLDKALNCWELMSRAFFPPVLDRSCFLYLGPGLRKEEPQFTLNGLVVQWKENVNLNPEILGLLLSTASCVLVDTINIWLSH